MDHFPWSVDIGNFQIETFLEAQAAGVDRHQVGIVMEGAHQRENLSDFVPGEYGRQPPFPPCLGDGEQVPVFLEDVFEEELDAGIADAHGGWTPAGEVLSVDEIIKQFIFSDVIRCSVVMFDKLTHGPEIGLSGPFPHAVNLHGFVHF